METIRLYNVLQSARRVIETYKNGTFADFYFDKKRAAAEIEIGTALELESRLNTARYDVYEVQNYLLGSGELFALPNPSDEQVYDLKTYGALEFFSPTLGRRSLIDNTVFADLMPVGGS